MNDRNRGITLELASRFQQVRDHTLALIDGLNPEDCALQSMPDASPLKWHLAHTTWFWETFVLSVADSNYRHFDDSFRVLFNSYYNTVGAQFSRPRRGMLSRPDLATVLAYRRHVDAALRPVLDSLDAGSADMPPGMAATIELGLNHEQQHQELMLTDLLHLLDINPLSPRYRRDGPRPLATAARSQWCRSPGGLVPIGHDGNGFSFDNELPAHRTWLEPFELASRLVTNGQYRQFIEDDGYRRPEFWLSEGFDVACTQAWQAPLYWRREGDQWHEFSLAGQAPLDDDQPVTHLSYFEADAYARFAGARLPTEFEWEHAARSLSADLDDLDGCVWQWTASSYAAYPGFCAAADAIGEYNGKFMVNQYVLRGSSCATPPGHARRTYRNFFPASARWQFSGIRLARSDPN